MSVTKHALGALGMLVMCALSACAFSDPLRHCSNASMCPQGQECYEGLCIQGKDTSKNSVTDPKRNDAGMNTRPDAGGPQTDAQITTDPGKDAAADGGDVSNDAARADAAPTTDAGGGCAPGDMKACTLGPMVSTTAALCNKGYQRCENGVFGACIADATPSNELCNGVDDDCDGKADEGTDTFCYPEGQMGCTLPTNGSAPTCQGLCALGKRLCRNGALQACTGAVVPKKETCDANGTSSDENCNGMIDEGCECTGNQVRSCYNGPANTLGVGKCRAGTQSCQNGVLTACAGALVPEPETCANPNVDNDCNDMLDDIKDRGMPCMDMSKKGICVAGTWQCQGSNSPDLVCVTKSGTTETCNDLDDDCDGKTDETFMLQSDPNHCGSCSKVCASGENCCGGQCSNPASDNNNCGGCGSGHTCGANQGCCAGQCIDFLNTAAHCGGCGQPCGLGQGCCGGKCMDTKSDMNNCGMCGMVCSAGLQPACCDGSCVDLQSNEHCGSCNNPCGVLAVTCTCAVMNGVPQCVAPTLDLCL